MPAKKLDEKQVQSTLTNAIKQAVDFIESEVAPEQIAAQNAFDGKTKVKSEANRSKVVDTVCRDSVRAIKPGLMRLFLQSGQPVEFVPTGPETADQAKQATQYASYVFDKSDGFGVLHAAIHDALVKKVGVVKAFYDDTPDVEMDEYTGLSEPAAMFILDDPDVEPLEIEIETEAETAVGPDGVSVEIAPAVYSMKVSRTSSYGETKIVGIAPEDFFVDRGATSLSDFHVCGDSTEMTVGDVVEMGFDFDEVLALSGREGDDEQEFSRGGHSTNDDENNTDPSMRPVDVTEAYMRMDIEGTGIPKLYKFICAGDNYTVLARQDCDYVPYAIFEVDPEPHAFFGRSLVDIIKDDQDAATSMLRGLLDNIALLNNPGISVDMNTVNMGDVLNNEIGRVIRVKGPPSASIQEQVVGSGATMALPAIQHYQQVIRQKTGILGAGMGLDAEALQSQTAAGVRLADQTSNAVPELIARVIAEGGMTQLFRLIAKIGRQHPDPQQMMVDGEFVEVDPRSWSLRMDMKANVGIGTNAREEKAATLSQIITWQQGIWQAYGPNNGLVTMTGIRSAMADLAEIGGVHSVDRYIEPMNKETEAQLAQQAQAEAAAQSQGSDPNAAFVQVEQMKTQQKAQSDMAEHQRKVQKDQTDAQIKVGELAGKDDLARDKMAQDLLVEAAKMSNQPAPVRVIQHEQDKPRV